MAKKCRASSDISVSYRRRPADSFQIQLNGGDISLGCKLCTAGAKMVLFVTGQCKTGRFYCPLSEEKKGIDGIWANEKLIRPFEGKSESLSRHDLEEIAREAEEMDALGTGITGGDPFLYLARTCQIIRFLKKRFGERHHVHLYTTGIYLESCRKKKGRKMEMPVETFSGCNAGCEVPTDELYTILDNNLMAVADAGLDEIRFHPPPEFWNYTGLKLYRFLLETARKYNMKAGIEVPALPDKADLLAELIAGIADCADFINLNELEFSSTNALSLKKRGYTIASDISASVKGSKEAAATAWKNAVFILREKMGKEVAKDNQHGTSTVDERGVRKIPSLNIHFCSSRFKDTVQLRRRMLRRARHIAHPFEYITNEGTIMVGVIESDNPMVIEDLDSVLALEYSVPADLRHIEERKGEMEKEMGSVMEMEMEDNANRNKPTKSRVLYLASWILQELSEELARRYDVRMYISEVYPTSDRLEVERIPLHDRKA
ncbi:MAG: hypothetical protein QW728_00060 [Thermoplasmata archaeon]